MMSLLSPHPLPTHTPRAHTTAALPRRGPTLPAHRPHLTPDPHRFNTVPADEAERALLTCCRSLRWARRIAAHRPYPDLPALLAAADEAAYDLAPADLAEALAGESLTLLPDGAYSAAQTALSAAHAAYESRFGHVFVICLDDVAPDEAADQVLAGIRSRWNNDPEDERVAAAEELRRLARGRLARLVRDYADSTAATEGTAPESPGSERPSRPYVPH
nr:MULTISPECIES: 2-oxo-4-hydroxy-4-carboxy-5-ureidoimidazoline decarboxylase [unclassified Streptomyces]